jgi:cell division protein FtsB
MISTLFLLLLVAYLARWVVSSAGSRPDRQLEAQHTAEIARLREEVDQLTTQVVRLQDEQSFTMRLLTGGERPPAVEPPAGQAPPTPTTTTEIP